MNVIDIDSMKSFQLFQCSFQKPAPNFLFHSHYMIVRLKMMISAIFQLTHECDTLRTSTPYMIFSSDDAAAAATCCLLKINDQAVLLTFYCMLID